MNYEKIRDTIKAHNVESKSKAEKYETAKAWSYAYLTRWVVLESGLKLLYDENNKLEIRKGATEWINYLDGKIDKAPKKISNFSIQTQTIPTLKFIVGVLGTCNSIKNAIDSTGKYRPKRNRIAHKAEEFRSESDYKGYCKVIDLAITQLIAKLSTEANKKYNKSLNTEA